ncbi:hypothetical protein KEM48_009661 [Puccinia striiformis f. sp. tritici PST-130]|uniref:Uncharacterized protein n=1 Tax=Puccinia striiformis f. sp. tritici PST-78 TaxID=1165861 RepID=A0A0L0VUH8_9BASI|nr:hypothetical protein H4Q26_010011 [Puccinia striiformis f. sp. tritici PST-130]KAI9623044.1 hypothetical protein KEM48_009661 [Puccinia striiformis f. sp. tritici PST-130]KNF02640.1 hypothetical protein PSTG_04237 [Puccinia striiformis f. sp. tritici PST-78]
MNVAHQLEDSIKTNRKLTSQENGFPSNPNYSDVALDAHPLLQRSTRSVDSANKTTRALNEQGSFEAKGETRREQWRQQKLKSKNSIRISLSIPVL